MEKSRGIMGNCKIYLSVPKGRIEKTEQFKLISIDSVSKITILSMFGRTFVHRFLKRKKEKLYFFVENWKSRRSQTI